MFLSQKIERALEGIVSDMSYGEPVIKNEASLVFSETDVKMPLCTAVANELKEVTFLKPKRIAERISFALNTEFPHLAYFHSSSAGERHYVNMLFTEQGLVSLLYPFSKHLNTSSIPLDFRYIGDYKKLDSETSIEPWNVSIEYISANPTGPLHVGHLTQAIIGNSLSNIFKANGFNVTREYYCNDAGKQIDNLVKSVVARANGIGPGDSGWSDDYYAGEYVSDLASTVLAAGLSVSGTVAQDELRAFVIDTVSEWHKATIEKLDSGAFTESKESFGKLFKVTSERSLFESGEVDRVIDTLIENTDKTYRTEDGALWFKSTDFGDETDRVMVKSNGVVTYFVPDVAYHLRKISGSTDVINIQGSDHHGTALRVKAAVELLSGLLNTNNGDEVPIEHMFLPMVKIIEDGEEVKMSKRSGSFLTADEMLEKHDINELKWFILSRKNKTELVFDKNGKGKNDITSCSKLFRSIVKTMRELSELRKEEYVFSTQFIIQLRSYVDFYEVFSATTPQYRANNHYWQSCKNVGYVARSIYLYPSVLEAAIRDKSSTHITEFIRKLTAALSFFLRDLAEKKKSDVALYDEAGNEFMTGLVIEASYTLLSHAFMLLDIDLGI